MATCGPRALWSRSGRPARSDVPAVIKQLAGYRRWADRRLRRMLRDSDESTRDRLHASLALLPVDSSQADYLGKRLLGVAPADLPVLRAALAPHRSRLTPTLWTELEKARPGDPSLLASGAALALYDPDGPRWSELGGKVAEALVQVNPIFLGHWLDALRPVRGRLAEPLQKIFVRGGSEAEHELATNILANYAADDPDRLAGLLMAADPKAYLTLFPIAERQAQKLLPHFKAELEKRATFDWNDEPLDPVMDEARPCAGEPDRSGPGPACRTVRLLPGDAAGRIRRDRRSAAAVGLSPGAHAALCRWVIGEGCGGLDPRRAEMADRIGPGGRRGLPARRESPCERSSFPLISPATRRSIPRGSRPSASPCSGSSEAGRVTWISSPSRPDDPSSTAPSSMLAWAGRRRRSTTWRCCRRGRPRRASSCTTPRSWPPSWGKGRTRPSPGSRPP